MTRTKGNESKGNDKKFRTTAIQENPRKYTHTYIYKVKAMTRSKGNESKGNNKKSRTAAIRKNPRTYRYIYEFFTILFLLLAYLYFKILSRNKG